MKTNFLKRMTMLMMALAAVVMVGAQAQKQPKGLYHLNKFIYEDGREQAPGFSQYKYAADSLGLLIFYEKAHDEFHWSSVRIEIREPHPLLFTGEKAQGEDGHGTQIFNVTDEQFYFKWFNTNWPNMSKLNEFITEVYTKENIEGEVAKAFSLLENKIEPQTNKFYGFWIRLGLTENTDGTGRRMDAAPRWKVYAPEMSMVIAPQRRVPVLACNTTQTVRYENDNTIFEIGHRCDIHWIDNDTHTLTYEENGRPITELWARGGLPLVWQSVFNTNVPLYRDGVVCMEEAQAAMANGDRKAAEKLIDEAIKEKNVPLPVLCEGSYKMASYLLQKVERYQECADFSDRQLKKIREQVQNGEDFNAASRFFTRQVEIFKAVATYLSGEQKKGKKLLEDCLNTLNSEIERFQKMPGMEGFLNTMYYCKFVAYDMGYEALGAEETLLNLEALSLMAPQMSASIKLLIMRCRGNCYLLTGAKDDAKKIWENIKAEDPNFFKNEEPDSRLKKAFGE